MGREQWGHGYYTGVKDGIRARISFYDFCLTMHDGEDSALGDFVFDMKRDKAFPKSATECIKYDSITRSIRPYNSYRKCIYDHLVHSGACVDARKAFLELWKEWKSVK